MHLQQHFGWYMRNRLGHAHHRAADHIGRSALNRRIDRGAFGETCMRAFRPNFRRMNAPSKQGLHIAMFFGESDGIVHIGSNAWEAGEICVDKRLGLRPWNAQVARKAKARNAINHSKVNGLRLSAYLRGHLIQRHIKHLTGGQCVNINAIGKGLFQSWNIGNMSQNAQLDL